MKRRKLLLIIALVLVAGLLAGFGGLLSIGPPDFDPKTRVYYRDDPGFGDASAVVFVGYWNDGTESRGLLDAPQYATSWKATGSSEAAIPVAETVFSVGAFKGVAGASPNQPEWRYYVWQQGDASWTLVKRTPAGTPVTFGVAKAAFLPPNPLYYFQGVVDGWLRVELWGSWWTPGLNILDGDAVNDLRYEGRFIGDDAKLVSGRGTIVEPSELKVYNVGETISIRVDLGTACSQKVSSDGIISQGAGWTLELFSAGQARTVKTWDLGCGPGQTGVDAAGAKLTYVVAAADFVAASGVCKNTLELSLFNELFLKDKTSVKTIDIEKVAKPAPPTITVTAPGGVWEEGEPISVTVNTTETGATVNLVVESELGTELLRIERSPLRIFSFQPTVSGIYTITASIEVNCGASDPVFYKVTIKDKTPPNTTGGASAGAFPLLAVILLIVGVLLILAAVFLPVPLLWKLILIVIAVALILIAAASLAGVL